MATEKSSTIHKQKSNTRKTKRKKSGILRWFKFWFFKFMKFIGVKDRREALIIFVLCVFALSLGFFSGIYFQFHQQPLTVSAAKIEKKIETPTLKQKVPVTLDIQELLPEEDDIQQAIAKPEEQQTASLTRPTEDAFIKPYKQRSELDTRPYAGKKGRVVIIIDDMGVDVKHSAQVLNELKAPLTLSYLPYGNNLPKVTAKAKALGHELMVHVPMEPMDESWGLGPRPLLVSASEQEITANLEWSLSQFDGYVGINNHMGSKFTSNPKAMAIVAKDLKDRDLIFVDSVTSPKSIAYQATKEEGIITFKRDVFLDNLDNEAYVLNQLDRLEKVAKANGYAIAIGHPRAATIEALAKWLPTVKEKGLTIVPLSSLVN